MAIFPLKPGIFWPGDFNEIKQTENEYQEEENPELWENLSSDPEVWTTAYNAVIPIKELEDSHLENIVRMLRRWAESELEDDGFILHYALDENGDGDLIVEHQQIVDNRCAARCLQWPRLISELQRRKSKMKDLEDGWYWSHQAPHLVYLIQGGDFVGFGNLGSSELTKEQATQQIPRTIVWQDSRAPTLSGIFFIKAGPNYDFLKRDIEGFANKNTLVKVRNANDRGGSSSMWMIPACLSFAGLVSVLAHKSKAKQCAAAKKQVPVCQTR